MTHIFWMLQMSSACRRYQSDMAELSDQVRLLYREHSNSTASWQQKCSTAEKQVGSSAGPRSYAGSTALRINDNHVRMREGLVVPTWVWVAAAAAGAGSHSAAAGGD